MIIRNRTTKTLETSPLNNRGVRSTPGCQPASASTLKGSPLRNDGALFQSACSTIVCQPGGARYTRTRGYQSEDRIAVSLVV